MTKRLGKHMPIAALILGVALVAVFHQTPGRGALQAKTLPPLAPPAALKHMTLGYNDILSDSLWLRVIQDLDRPCDEVASPAAKSDAVKPRACHRSWVYQMLDLITELAPKFRMPYVMGATVLSVAVGDTEGARLIFEKGLRVFPSDWSLAYRAGYHYLEEVGDKERAGELLLIAAKNGAPPWVYALASRLFTDEGKALLAKSILEEAIAQDPQLAENPRIRQRLKEANMALSKAH